MSNRQMILYNTIEEWQNDRKRWIGASDVPVLFGVSYLTPLQLWMQRTGRTPQTENVRLEIGHALEPVVQKLATSAVVAEVGEGQVTVHQPPPSQHRIPAPHIHPRLAVTLDLWTLEQPEIVLTSAFAAPPCGARPLELKTVATGAGDEWGEEPHPHAAVQTAVQVAALEADSGRVFAMFGLNQDRRLYTVAAPPVEFVALVRAKIQAFWECLERDVPPEPLAGDSGALSALYRNPRRQTVLLSDPHFPALVEDLKRVREAMAELKKAEEGLSNELRAALGDRTRGVIEGTDVAVSWPAIPGRNVPAHELEPCRGGLLLGKAKKADWEAARLPATTEGGEG